MRTTMTLAIVALFAGVALAGCTGGQDPGKTPDTATPEAIASHSPYSPLASQSVSFDATPSQAGGRTVASAAWDFGDGTTGTGITTTHTYANPGDHVVRLTITSAANKTATNDASLMYVRVAPKAVILTNTSDPAATEPVAILAADRTVIKPGDTVSFLASESHGWIANAKFKPDVPITATNSPLSKSAAAITGYSLDFGDGSPPATFTDPKNATNHTYANAGSYAAKLTVTSTGGSASSVFTVVVLTAPPAVTGAPNKDVFVTATLTGPKSLDPAYEYDASSGGVVEQVYEPLFGYDRGDLNKPIPILAAEVPTSGNGGISADSLAYTIKIRQGVKFHDGTELDAEAVKFSFDRLIMQKDPNSAVDAVFKPIFRGAAEFLASDGTQADRDAYLARNAVEVKDKYTIVLNLPAPDASVIPRLSYNAASIVSPTAFKAPHPERTPLWGAATTSDGLTPPATATNPPVTRDPWADLHAVGTGPYTIRAWLPNDRIIFDRYDGHWDTAHPAKIKTVIIQYVDDLTTRLLMLKSGQADDIYVNPANIDTVRPQIEGIARIIPIQSLNIRQLAFMFDIDPASGECPKDATTQQADCQFFQDKHMRKAFSYAFDYDQFKNNVMKGRVARLHGVIPQGMPGYDPNLKGYDTDLEKARGELALSNHPDGFSINLYYNSGNTAREGACNIMKAQLESLSPNIKVNVIAVDFATLTDKMQSQGVAFMAIGWGPDYVATDDFLVPYYSSTGLFPVSFGYNNATVDAALKAALDETDAAEQARLYAEVEAMAVEDAPYIFLTQDTVIHVERTWVSGYYYGPTDANVPLVGHYKDIEKL